jgi:hypothetical protein
MEFRGAVTLVSIAGLILVAAIALLIFGTWVPSEGNPPGGLPTPTVTPTQTMGIVTTRPSPSFPPTRTTTAGTPHPTVTTIRTTAPVTTAIPLPTVTTIGTAAPVTTGTPSFSISVNPVSAVAGPGDLVTYHMTIAGTNGFSDPVQLSLHVSAVLVYNRDYDLGTQYPPYPKTVDYPFTVPSNVPRGITVNGLLTARSGSVIHQVPLILQVV